MKKAWRWFRCRVLQDHEWTCKAEQGIPPDQSEIPLAHDIHETLRRFNRYAQGYCKHCPKKHNRVRKIMGYTE